MANFASAYKVSDDKAPVSLTAQLRVKDLLKVSTQ